MVVSRIPEAGLSRGVGFLDVLRQLSVPAADALQDQLKRYNCLASARLTCQSLRDLIDGSVRELDLDISERNLRIWRSRPPSLARWPRCESLTFDTTKAFSSDLSTAAALTAPLSGLSLEARNRITHLYLRDNDQMKCPETVVTLLVHRLPGLRHVALRDVEGMTYGRASLQLLYDALGSLPRLESLSLPDCRALAGLGAFADTTGGAPALTRLEVHGVSENTEIKLPAIWVKGMAQLRSLRELTFDHCTLNDMPDDEGDASAGDGCEALRALVLSLPPSLETLHLSSCHLTHPCGERLSVTLRQQCGQLVQVEVAGEELFPIINGYLTLPVLSLVARKWLLPCVQSLAVLPRLVLNRVMIEGPGVEPAALLEPLQALVGHCRGVELRELKIGQQAPLAAVEQALEVLGSRPTELEVHIDQGIMLRCNLPGRQGAVGAGCGAGGGSQSEALGGCSSAAAEAAAADGATGCPPPPPMTAVDLRMATWRAFLHRTTTRTVRSSAAAPPLQANEPTSPGLGAGNEAGTAAAPPGTRVRCDGEPASLVGTAARSPGSASANAGATNAPSVSTPAPGRQPPSDVLLFGGSLVAFLKQDKGMLRSWMQAVETRAAAAVAKRAASAWPAAAMATAAEAATAPRRGDGSGDSDNACMATYTPLPYDMSAVLVVCAPGRGAAVAEAARGLSQWPLLAPTLRLSFVPVAPRSRRWQAAVTWKSSAAVLATVIEEAVQEVCDQFLAHSGLTEEALRWLHALQKDLAWSV